MSTRASLTRRLDVIVALCFIATTVLAPQQVFAAPCWPPPVDAAVTDPFREPECPWCPGNRGIEYATEAGDEVVSVAAGRVSYAGTIAGVSYVVVEIANGWRITYGNLAETNFGVGNTVVAGVTIGRASGPFHFGLREDERYLDPTPFLGDWVYRVRLVPTDGSQAAPAPPPSVRCGSRSFGSDTQVYTHRRERTLRR